MARPEHSNPPDVFYNESEAKKYALSSRMMEIQTKMTDRSLELLSLPNDGIGKLILDIGCGTGLSSQVAERAGHVIIGIDISVSMLEVGRVRGIHQAKNDSLLWDMGSGFGFRPGMFDGVISISALQWLCNADTSAQNPIRRINRFFDTLYGCLVRGARAVFQFYPENPQQVEMLTKAALKAGFTGGLLVDYPNSAKAKKYGIYSVQLTHRFFLVLFAGKSGSSQMPKALDDDNPEGVRFETERRRKKGRRGDDHPTVKSKEWILNKKERRRLQGKSTAHDSKYTGRKRGPQF